MIVLVCKCVPTQIYVQLARTLYTRCMYGIISREKPVYTVLYGVYIRFWPTLIICTLWTATCQCNAHADPQTLTRVFVSTLLHA